MRGSIFLSSFESQSALSARLRADIAPGDDAVAIKNTTNHFDHCLYSSKDNNVDGTLFAVTKNASFLNRRQAKATRLDFPS